MTIDDQPSVSGLTPVATITGTPASVAAPTVAPARGAAPVAGRPDLPGGTSLDRLLRYLRPHQGGRFASLDGFRAVASLGVVVYHVAGYAGMTAGGSPTARFLNNLGNFGVAVFFLLSGFLLYRPFVMTWFRGELPPRTFVYYRHRFLRILPAYWIALSAFIALGLLSAKDPKPDYFLTLFSLTQNYRKAFGFAGLSVAWTLCIEVAFYLVLPLIAALIRFLGRHARSPRMMLEAQLLGLATMYLVSLIYRFVLAGPWTLDLPQNQYNVVHLWIFNYLDWFALGMSLAVCVSWTDMGRRLPRLVQQVADTGWACWLGALGCYVVLMLLRDIVPVAGPQPDESTAEQFVRFFLNGGAALLFLVPGILGRKPNSLITRGLASLPLMFLGTISYGIYLWHKVWLDKFKVGHDGAANRYSFLVMLVLVIGATIVTASLSYYLVERPLMKFRDPKHLRSRPKTTASA